MAGRRWVQASLFDGPREQEAAQQPDVVGARRREQPTRRRESYVRVTRDADVALAADESSRLSSEVTWQLAQQLTDERIEQLRKAVGRRSPPIPASSPAEAPASP